VCAPHSKDIWMTESAEHITCQEVVELVTDYLETALPADETALFEQHLNFCEGCVWYLDQMRETIGTVGRLREEDVPEHTRAQLLTAFRDWKRS
jgi:anti-sigma factor RsiW